MATLVTGANGRTGFLCVQELVRRGIETVGLVRRAEHAPRIQEAGGRPVLGDLTQSCAHALVGVDAVVFAASNTFPADPDILDHRATVAFAEACARLGVRRFVLISSLGTTFPDQMPPFLRPYLIAKRQAEVFLEGADLEHTIVRPGGLTDAPASGMVTFNRTRAAGRQVSRADVAAVAVGALLHPNTIGKAFDVLQGDQGVEEALRGV